MANDLLVIDIKAPGFCSQSYPISIGVAGPEDQVWAWLVYPLEDWFYWDAAFDDVHGIRKSQLLEQGRDGFIVCREMNAIFKGMTLVSHSAWTHVLVVKLFESLGVGMAFALVTLEQFLPEGTGARLMAEIEKISFSNVSSEDAQMVWKLVSESTPLALYSIN